MNTLSNRLRRGLFCRLVTSFVILSFGANLIGPLPSARAQSLPMLPQVGHMVTPSPAFMPPILKGMVIYPDNPLKFGFLVDNGDSRLKSDELKDESIRMIKYFLASLTTPKEDLWVNLSPYEQDRIIPQKLGETEMGRDLLAQDYILKQLTASLIYPEDELGKKFWDKVYKKAYERYGVTDIPVDTFNKVWIVPDRAVVYERGNTAFVIDSYLKVMLEEDYLAQTKNTGDEGRGTKDENPETSQLTSDIIKELILPEIEHEINNGKAFTQLRQIYHAMILSVWFKRNLQKSLLGQIFVDKNKTAGMDVEDKEIKQKIYNQYIAAFKKGVYNYIKEDFDPRTKQMIPRKYFSGGLEGSKVYDVFEEITGPPPSALGDYAMAVEQNPGRIQQIDVNLQPARTDQAMTGDEDLQIAGRKTQAQEQSTPQLKHIWTPDPNSQKIANDILIKTFVEEMEQFGISPGTEEYNFTYEQEDFDYIVDEAMKRLGLTDVNDLPPESVKWHSEIRDTRLAAINRELKKAERVEVQRVWTEARERIANFAEKAIEKDGDDIPVEETDSIIHDMMLLIQIFPDPTPEERLAFYHLKTAFFRLGYNIVRAINTPIALGFGTKADVFLAQALERDGKEVVIKVDPFWRNYLSLPSKSDDPYRSQYTLFMNHNFAEIANQFESISKQNPLLVDLYEAGEVEVLSLGTKKILHYQVMEYNPGKPIIDYIRRTKISDPDSFLNRIIKDLIFFMNQMETLMLQYGFFYDDYGEEYSNVLLNGEIIMVDFDQVKLFPKKTDPSYYRAMRNNIALIIGFIIAVFKEINKTSSNQIMAVLRGEELFTQYSLEYKKKSFSTQAEIKAEMQKIRRMLEEINPKSSDAAMAGEPIKLVWTDVYWNTKVNDRQVMRSLLAKIMSDPTILRGLKINERPLPQESSVRVFVGGFTARWEIALDFQKRRLTFTEYKDDPGTAQGRVVLTIPFVLREETWRQLPLFEETSDVIDLDRFKAILRRLVSQRGRGLEVKLRENKRIYIDERLSQQYEKEIISGARAIIKTFLEHDGRMDDKISIFILEPTTRFAISLEQLYILAAAGTALGLWKIEDEMRLLGPYIVDMNPKLLGLESDAAMVASNWGEAKSRELSRMIVEAMQLEPLYLENAGMMIPRFDRFLHYGTNYYDREKLVWPQKSSNGFSFVRVGHLFFLDEDLYQALSEKTPEVITDLGSNVIRIKDLPASFIGDWAKMPSVFATIAAMFDGNLPERVWDLGAGDGVLSLVAAKLGVDSMVLVENNEEYISSAKDNMELNGLKENVNFYLLDEDLLETEKLKQRIQDLDLHPAETWVISNIGLWPSWEPLDNQTSIKLIRHIEQDTASPVTGFIASGYGLSIDETFVASMVEEYIERGHNQDEALVLAKQMAQKILESPQNDQRAIQSLGFTVAESKGISDVLGGDGIPAFLSWKAERTPTPDPAMVGKEASATRDMGERVQAAFVDIVSDPTGERTFEKRRQWLVNQLGISNKQRPLFGQADIETLAAVLARLFSQRVIIEFLESQDRYLIYEDMGSGDTVMSSSWEKATEGLVGDNDLEKLRSIYAVYKLWEREYRFPKGTDEERRGMIQRFEKEVTGRYPLIRLTGKLEAFRPSMIEAAIYILNVLPTAMLRSEVVEQRLYGGIDLASGRFLGSRIAQYIEEKGLLGVQPTVFDLRKFIETFFHEFGHLVQAEHVNSEDFLTLYESALNNMYAIPAVGDSASARQENASRVVEEFFAETFMHYILRGEEMSKGFPNFANNAKLWKEVYAYYRNRVFGGVEYRIQEGQLKVITSQHPDPAMVSMAILYDTTAGELVERLGVELSDIQVRGIERLTRKTPLRRGTNFEMTQEELRFVMTTGIDLRGIQIEMNTVSFELRKRLLDIEAEEDFRGFDFSPREVESNKPDPAMVRGLEDVPPEVMEWYEEFKRNGVEEQEEMLTDLVMGNDPSKIPYLKVVVLGDAHWYPKQVAVEKIGGILTPEARILLENLLTMHNGEEFDDKRMRGDVAEALAHHGVEAAPSLENLLLQDAKFSVRYRAAESLVKIQPPQLGKIFLKVLDQEEEKSIRKVIAEGLSDLDDSKQSIAGLIVIIKESEDFYGMDHTKYEREAALKLGEKGSVAIPYLMELLEMDEETYTAAMGLVELGGIPALEIILEYLSKRSELWHEAVDLIWAAGEIGLPEEEAPELFFISRALVKIFLNHPEIAKEVYSLISTLKGRKYRFIPYFRDQQLNQIIELYIRQRGFLTMLAPSDRANISSAFLKELQQDSGLDLGLEKEEIQAALANILIEVNALESGNPDIENARRIVTELGTFWAVEVQDILIEKLRNKMSQSDFENLSEPLDINPNAFVIREPAYLIVDRVRESIKAARSSNPEFFVDLKDADPNDVVNEFKVAFSEKGKVWLKMVLGMREDAVIGPVDILRIISDVEKNGFDQMADMLRIDQTSNSKSSLNAFYQEALKRIMLKAVERIEAEPLVLKVTLGEKEVDLKNDEVMPSLSEFVAHHPEVGASQRILINGWPVDKEDWDRFFILPGDHIQPDEAMTSKTPGGIDFNPDRMDVEIRRDGNGIPLSRRQNAISGKENKEGVLDGIPPHGILEGKTLGTDVRGAPPVEFQNINLIEVDGFVPVIIQMTPVMNLYEFLGLNENDENEGPNPSARLKIKNGAISSSVFENATGFDGTETAWSTPNQNITQDKGNVNMEFPLSLNSGPGARIGHSKDPA